MLVILLCKHLFSFNSETVFFGLENALLGVYFSLDAKMAKGGVANG